MHFHDLYLYVHFFWLFMEKIEKKREKKISRKIKRTKMEHKVLTTTNQMFSDVAGQLKVQYRKI